ELVVHGWDLGVSQGTPPALTRPELAAIEDELPRFGANMYTTGLFKQPVEVPEGADRQTKLLARMGRAATVSSAEMGWG
ncbi:MAG TPA: hypothetical protein VFU85_01645, partial [Nocardioides sp.]|nr:hypothetical protein [Nocardioides sp.]